MIVGNINPTQNCFDLGDLSELLWNARWFYIVVGILVTLHRSLGASLNRGVFLYS